MNDVVCAVYRLDITLHPQVHVYIHAADSHDRVLAYLQCKGGRVTVYNRLMGALHVGAFVEHADFDVAVLQRGDAAIDREFTRLINAHGRVEFDNMFGVPSPSR